jgi:mycothiol synthase
MMGMDLPSIERGANQGFTIRRFNSATDFETWIGLNRLAFKDHPEQGAWSGEDLLQRLNEPWFDPSGFLVILQDEEIVASVWTKVHELNPSREGEIYVLWVAPAHQGKGLGAIATAAGLRSLALKGATRVILFVEETNHSARELYASFGFTIERQDHLVLFER